MLSLLYRAASSRYFQRSFCTLLAALVFGMGVAGAGGVWPDVTLPKNVNTYNIGEQMSVNGMPMRMQGFLAKDNVSELAQWFRQSMGKPLMENRLDRKLILGRAEGEYYVSVQLEATPQGTRGLIAVTQLQAAFDHRAETAAASERLLMRMPAGSHLQSRMTSNDAGKVATFVVMDNDYSEELNRDRLVGMMQQDGLVLERETSPVSSVTRPLPAAMANSKILFFKGQGKEAIAVIKRNDLGRSTIVLNTTTQMERFK
jgi:hypothetical protein